MKQDPQKEIEPNPDEVEARVFTVREVSRMAKIGEGTVRRLVRRGILRQCPIPGVAVLRISAESVRQLLEGGTENGDPALREGI